MAGAACKGGVGPGQCITRVFEVVKLGVEPAIHGVTVLAGGRQAKADVVKNRREEVLLVAGIAGG